MSPSPAENVKDTLNTTVDTEDGSDGDEIDGISNDRSGGPVDLDEDSVLIKMLNENEGPEEADEEQQPKEQARPVDTNKRFDSNLSTSTAEMIPNNSPTPSVVPMVPDAESVSVHHVDVKAAKVLAAVDVVPAEKPAIRDYDSNPTKLYELLQKKEWPEVIDHVSTAEGSAEASIWMARWETSTSGTAKVGQEAVKVEAPTNPRRIYL